MLEIQLQQKKKEFEKCLIGHKLQFYSNLSSKLPPYTLFIMSWGYYSASLDLFILLHVNLYFVFCE